MTTNPFDRAAIGIGAIGVLSPVFGLSNSTNTNFVMVQNAGLFVLLALGVLAVAGGLLSRPRLVLVAGAAYAVAAVLQLAQFGRTTNWLQGNGSTFTLMAALALGLLVVALNRPTDDRS